MLREKRFSFTFRLNQLFQSALYVLQWLEKTRTHAGALLDNLQREKTTH